MRTLERELLFQFVNENIDTFHESRLQILERIDLKKVLKNKNPYLFAVKNLQNPDDLIRSMLDALLSSSEEKVFGDFLEALAIFVSEQTCSGRKSSAAGIDLEFDDDGVRYLVAIKSGPNWGNSDQYKSLRENFRRARIVQNQAHSGLNIQPVLGMCYGKRRDSDTGLYLTRTGQSFWNFISGDLNLYSEIIEPLRYRAEFHNERFIQGRLALHQILVQEFVTDFCFSDGRIDWDKLVRFNSGNL